MIAKAPLRPLRPGLDACQKPFLLPDRCSTRPHHLCPAAVPSAHLVKRRRNFLPSETKAPPSPPQCRASLSSVSQSLPLIHRYSFDCAGAMLLATLPPHPLCMAEAQAATAAATTTTIKTTTTSDWRRSWPYPGLVGQFPHVEGKAPGGCPHLGGPHPSWDPLPVPGRPPLQQGRSRQHP
jgi:hypothetical protein